MEIALPEGHRTQEKKHTEPLKTATKTALLLAACAGLIFSFYLMFHTFSYDGASHRILIATKAWSDFGAHIPLIRSFTYGPNSMRLMNAQPVESPLYPGEPIRYHFGFYALVGMLEKTGVPIDWAFNFPSAIGFFLLLVCIFVLSYALFSDFAVSGLSVLFFLLNGSLSFLTFFRANPLSDHSISDIVRNSRFPSFGPWDGGDITAFWNLNIYTNQRHLALSYAIILMTVWLLIRPLKHRKDVWSRGIVIGLLASLLLFFNYPAALILFICALSVFIIRKNSRVPLIFAGLLSLPALGLLIRVAHIGSDIVWKPGYLVSVLTPVNVMRFWFENVGLHLILIPVGLILAPRTARKLFLGPLLVLFILPNLIRFSPDMINNHKFFNFVLIIGNMFSAYAVIRLLKLCGRIPGKYLAKSAQFIFTVLIISMLTMSGVIDLFAVINDSKGAVPDRQADPDVRFFLERTPYDAVIANSTWFYHPASLAGRSIFSGYTYFTWSYGYNQGGREAVLKDIYEAPSLSVACSLLKSQNISYIELNEHTETYLAPNLALWHSLHPVYVGPVSRLAVYQTADICTGDQ